MRFWIRHVFLVLACVVGPFIAAIFFDTASEIRRTRRASEIAGRLATQGLEARLTLDAHARTSQAITLAQGIGDRDLVGEVSKAIGSRKDAALTAVGEILGQVTPPGGFAWLIDEQGAVIARNGQKGPETDPLRITGHPLFVETQEGNALDGLWREGNRVSFVSAAPIVVRGQAQGAVFIAQPIDRTLLEGVGAALNAGVTFVSGDTVIASTLDAQTAAELVKAQGTTNEPVVGGSLKEPVAHAWLPLLPIFVDHQARGLAFTSLSATAPGLRDVRWLVSIDSAAAFRAIPARQELILSGLAIFMMLAILIGLVNHRTFVSPIEKLTQHLSELQLGRGELELPEARVSAPFRRLVKLINMTVQKIPARGFSSRGSSMSESPISELPGERVPPPRDGSSTASLLRTNDQRDDGAGYEPPTPQGPTTADLLGSTSPSPPPSPAPSPQRTQPLPSPAADLEIEPAASSTSDFGGETARHPQLMNEMAAQTAAENAAEAIAQAIASLEMPVTQAPPPVARPRGPSFSKGGAPPLDATRKGARSAADIRGVPSGSMGMPSPFAPSTSEMFRSSSGQLYSPRSDDQPDQRIGQGVPRSGGSLAYAGLGSSAGLGSAPIPQDSAFSPESTVVAPVEEELLRKSAREESTGSYRLPNAQQAEAQGGDMTMVASVPANLLAQTISDPEGEGSSDDGAGLDAADHAHFKETYERFIEMRKRCGEATGDLAFDRFLQKLTKNREGLIKKYNCRTVRFQVYEKDGKAALKATPVRSR
jgi:hypothetical protein